MHGIILASLRGRVLRVSLLPSRKGIDISSENWILCTFIAYPFNNLVVVDEVGAWIVLSDVA